MPFLAFLLNPAGRLAGLAVLIGLLLLANVVTYKAWRGQVNETAKAKAELAVATASGRACSLATRQLQVQAEHLAVEARAAVTAAEGRARVAEGRAHEILETLPDQTNLCGAATDLSHDEIKRRHQ